MFKLWKHVIVFFDIFGFIPNKWRVDIFIFMDNMGLLTIRDNRTMLIRVLFGKNILLAAYYGEGGIKLKWV